VASFNTTVRQMTELSQRKKNRLTLAFVLMMLTEGGIEILTCTNAWSLYCLHQKWGSRRARIIWYAPHQNIRYPWSNPTSRENETPW